MVEFWLKCRVKKSKIVHHDKLKHCQDSCIPLQSQHRRQELSSLGDTIPYDDQEHLLLDDLDDAHLSDLFPEDDSQIDSLLRSDTRQSSADVTDSDFGVDDISSPLCQSTQVFQRGRQSKTSECFIDYVK